MLYDIVITEKVGYIIFDLEDIQGEIRGVAQSGLER